MCVWGDRVREIEQKNTNIHLLSEKPNWTKRQPFWLGHLYWCSLCACAPWQTTIRPTNKKRKMLGSWTCHLVNHINGSSSSYIVTLNHIANVLVNWRFNDLCRAILCHPSFHSKLTRAHTYIHTYNLKCTRFIKLNWENICLWCVIRFIIFFFLVFFLCDNKWMARKATAKALHTQNFDISFVFLWRLEALLKLHSVHCSMNVFCKLCVGRNLTASSSVTTHTDLIALFLALVAMNHGTSFESEQTFQKPLLTITRLEYHLLEAVDTFVMELSVRHSIIVIKNMS